MIINWKDIVLKPYTRAMAREINSKIMAGVSANPANLNDVQIPMANMESANDFMIEVVTGLWLDEISGLLQSEYLDLLKLVTDHTIGGKKNNEETANRVRTFLEAGGKNAPQEYIDYILMTKIWHCSPQEFEKQEERMIDLHTRIYNEENRAEWKKQKRAEQRSSKK